MRCLPARTASGGTSTPQYQNSGASKRPEMTMTMNTMIPAIRRGLGRVLDARHRPGNRPMHRGPIAASPLSREEFRQAVIEVLG